MTNKYHPSFLCVWLNRHINPFHRSVTCQWTILHAPNNMLWFSTGWWTTPRQMVVLVEESGIHVWLNATDSHSLLCVIDTLYMYMYMRIPVYQKIFKGENFCGFRGSKQMLVGMVKRCTCEEVSILKNYTHKSEFLREPQNIYPLKISCRTVLVMVY